MFLSPLQALSHLPLEAGQRVADFGAGDGAYAFLLAEKLESEGAVYTLDLNGEAVESVRRESIRRSHANIFPLHTDLEEAIPLRDALLDSAVVANTLHALHERARFLDELHRTLKEHGAVLFVEWAASFNNMGPTKENAIGPAEAVRLFRAHAFEPGPMLPAGSHHYAFVARKT